jgi:hypothetical protein
MAAHPQHFEFSVNNDIISSSIIVCVAYGVCLIVSSLMRNAREKRKRGSDVEKRNLISEEE